MQKDAWHSGAIRRQVPMTENSNDLDELARELELDEPKAKASGRTHEEARVIAGFEEIVKFVDEHGRLPEHGEDRDIFERLYAVRLDRLRTLGRFRPLLTPLDTHDLLGAEPEGEADVDADLDDDALLDELDIDLDDQESITTLKHVKPRAEIQAADDIANRTPCADFELFEPLIAEIRSQLDAGIRETRPFAKEDASVSEGECFILSGQFVYVAEVGKEERRTKTERPDSRLRVVYDNGTESDILMRSLQRALYKDEAGRRVTDPVAGPLFSEPGDG